MASVGLRTTALARAGVVVSAALCVLLRSAPAEPVASARGPVVAGGPG